jgi:hypothetical protein
MEGIPFRTAVTVAAIVMAAMLPIAGQAQTTKAKQVEALDGVVSVGA